MAVAFAPSHLIAQPNFQRTRTVDPNGPPTANFSTIQAAINDVPNDTTDRWVIYIYAGKYTLNSTIALGGQEENIDLVGVDRDSVIIDMTADGSAIEITSGTESKRNNGIKNLTIKTTNGSGIRITKGLGINDKTPSNIIIENVSWRPAERARAIPASPAPSPTWCRSSTVP